MKANAKSFRILVSSIHMPHLEQNLLKFVLFLRRLNKELFSQKEEAIEWAQILTRGKPRINQISMVVTQVTHHRHPHKTTLPVRNKMGARPVDKKITSMANMIPVKVNSSSSNINMVPINRLKALYVVVAEHQEHQGRMT